MRRFFDQLISCLPKNLEIALKQETKKIGNWPDLIGPEKYFKNKFAQLRNTFLPLPLWQRCHIKHKKKWKIRIQ